MRARPDEDDAWVFDDGWCAAPASPSCARWRICRREACDEVRRNGPATRPTTLHELILANPMKRWSVSQAAKELGMSARSLQRRLLSENKTFSRVVADTRAATAVRLLDTTALSLNEIGFLSGYADQAQFTRPFMSAMAVSPRQHRTGA
ncbi:MAG: helix-turn-helix transcriptional regulator [Pseudomonadota bacterium]